LSALAPNLPALRIDARGRRAVDYRAVIALALPLFLNASLQAVLNLTDTWFVGRISAEAVAAVGAVYWLVLAIMLLLGGIGIAVQTLAAQAYGSGRRRRAAHIMWMGVYGSLATAPIFLAAAYAGAWLLAPFGLEHGIERLALDYWWPRLVGGAIAVSLWSVLSFFNGVGRTRIAFVVNLIVAVANAFLNELLMFRLDMGVAGAAWASTAAIAIGLALAVVIALRDDFRARFAIHRIWRPRWPMLRAAIALGLPTGLFIAFDVSAMAAFQLIQVRLGAVDGAATQIVMMLTSVAYMPAVGLGMASTTLVGQAIGAGDKRWAFRLGNAVIVLAVIYMTACGVLLALAGPWLMPFFVAADDTRAQEVVALGITLLWIAAAYQFFDGLNLGAGFGLRGAGDARVPAAALLVIGWGVFIPLAHMLAFAPGQGWTDALPQLGWGAAGGWIAAVVYVMLLGTTLALRWRSRAWQKLSVL
jgi:multidrug resistance protein, MATE family